MNEPQDIKDWFPEELTDETAYSIHLFLEQFTLQFEDRYYTQIRQHIEFIKEEHQTLNQDAGKPWEDDAIIF
jgi:hypothetical protein